MLQRSRRPEPKHKKWHEVRGQHLSRRGRNVAECPSILGCVSQGETEADAEANIAAAIRECLAVRAELGIPSTVTTREVEVAV
jgi:predicted RNase H-like HicB family nuclease